MSDRRLVSWALGAVVAGLVVGFFLALVWVGARCEAGIWDLHILD